MRVKKDGKEFALIGNALQEGVLDASNKIKNTVFVSADSYTKKALLKRAYTMALQKVGAKIDGNINCFMEGHDDHAPSMIYSQPKGGYHCFACMEPGIHFDLFDAITEIYELGEHSYKQAFAIACKLFVTGNPETAPAPIPITTDFTKEMIKAMHYQCHTPIADDELGLAYLAKRGISKELANKYGLQTWEYQGARYIVFINSNGSLVRRLIATNPEVTCMYSSTPTKWWNQKNSSGFFNFHCIEKAREKKELVFVCESAIDAISIDQCTDGIRSGEARSYAIGLNSTQNVPKFLRECDYPYLVILMDNDKIGQQASQLFKDKGYYVVDYKNCNCLKNYKDVNEALVAHDYFIELELQLIIADAEQFYGLEGGEVI